MKPLDVASVELGVSHLINDIFGSFFTNTVTSIKEKDFLRNYEYEYQGW